MKYVALISGGKDSCFNVIKCQEYGHELVCLANLQPQNKLDDEINSFMYQSAGHSIIPLQAQCFDKPLFRRDIRGKAKVTSMSYDSSCDGIDCEKDNISDGESNNYDEVEDLFHLLKEIKEYYQENYGINIQGVSCGAIASNYQRIRVEDVCSRLDMIPLTYLWQRNRMTLLNEMISNDYNLCAVLVKVAGAGLDPTKHLNKNLKTLHPTLLKLNMKYGLDMCGEGGEYESLVLDCSMFPNESLQILQSEIIFDDEDISVGNLRITDCQVIQKSNINNNDVIENISKSNLSYFTKTFCNQIFQIIRSMEDFLIQNFITKDTTVTVGNIQYKYKLSTISTTLLYEIETFFMHHTMVTTEIKPHTTICNKMLLHDHNINLHHHQIDDYWQTPLIRPKITAEVTNLCTNYHENKIDEENYIKLLADQQIKSIIDTLINLLNQNKNCQAMNSNTPEMNDSSIDYTYLQDVVYTQLYIQDMKLFSIINQAYSQYFLSTSTSKPVPIPPSRSCVAVPLFICKYDHDKYGRDIPTLVAASFTILQNSSISTLLESIIRNHTLLASSVIHTGNNDHQPSLKHILDNKRKTIYIRSISEWAPVCIGPFSQSNCLWDGLILISGQIPLDPGHMSIWSYDMIKQCKILNRIYQLAPDLLTIFSSIMIPKAQSIEIVDSHLNTENEIKTYWELFIIQYILCFRHVSSLLNIQNSNLSHSLSCTVYIDNKQFPKGFDVQQLKLFIIHFTNIIIQKDLFDIELHNCNLDAIFHNNDNATDDNDDSSTMTDSQDEKSEEEDISSNYWLRNMGVVTQLIFVNGLPKNALVEIEVKALTSSFPCESCTYLHNIITTDTDYLPNTKKDINSNITNLYEKRLIEIQRQTFQAILSPIQCVNDCYNFIDSHSSNNSNNEKETTNLSINNSTVSDGVKIKPNLEYISTNHYIIDNEKSLYQTKYYKQCVCAGSLDVVINGVHPHQLTSLNDETILRTHSSDSEPHQSVSDNNNSNHNSRREIVDSLLAHMFCKETEYLWLPVLSHYIATHILHQLIVSEISILFLKSITIYYVIESISENGLFWLKNSIKNLIISYIQHISKSESDIKSYVHFSMIMIPTSAPSVYSDLNKDIDNINSYGKTHERGHEQMQFLPLSVNYFAINLSKMRTEHWITSSFRS